MYSEHPWTAARERDVAEAKLEITDELLVAWVDDELDAAQRAMVSSVLAGNPALSRRAEEMRLARDLLREAFPLRPDVSVPAPIEAAANRLAEACAQRPSRRRPQSLFQRRRWRYAFVAGLVLCVAASVSYLAWRGESESTLRPVTALMRIGPDTPLHRVLESTPSAEVVNVSAEDAAMRAVLTFRAKDGRFCREFEILASSGGSTGIACRENGNWRAEVLLGGAAAPPNSNYYTPAAAADESAVAEVVERLMEGDPLSAQQEARVLASDWRAPHTP
jgi:hypothetical protein